MSGQSQNGNSYAIEARFAQSQAERVPVLVAELGQLQVDCLSDHVSRGAAWVDRIHHIVILLRLYRRYGDVVNAWPQQFVLSCTAQKGYNNDCSEERCSVIV